MGIRAAKEMIGDGRDGDAPMKNCALRSVVAMPGEDGSSNAGVIA
jgi:hypothetical protein